MDFKRIKKTEFQKNNIINTHGAFNYHWLVWRWTGIHPSSNVRHWLYMFYAILINLSVTLLFPITLVANLFFAVNMQQLCENLSITVTDIVANVKFINVFFVRSKLLLLRPILARLDQRAALGSEEERLILRSAVRISQRSFRIFVYIYTTGTTLSIVRVAIDKERKLLYPAWFYVDWKSSGLIFFLVNSYQLFGLVVQAIQNCANDSYPLAYLCVLAAHMQALAVRVRCIGLPISAEFNRVGEKIRLKEENYQKLKACIKDYLDILDLHAIVQHALSNACLAQFVGSALVQCTVAIHFLYVIDAKDFSAQILSVIFFIAVTLEMFLLCYFGHYMRERSEDLTMAFYSCEWVSQFPKFKQNLLITLARTQHPCIIMADKYWVVLLIPHGKKNLAEAYIHISIGVKMYEKGFPPSRNGMNNETHYCIFYFIHIFVYVYYLQKI